MQVVAQHPPVPAAVVASLALHEAELPLNPAGHLTQPTTGGVAPLFPKLVPSDDQLPSAHAVPPVPQVKVLMEPA